MLRSSRLLGRRGSFLLNIALTSKDDHNSNTSLVERGGLGGDRLDRLNVGT